MKPHRAFGLVSATAIAACLAAWLTPQQQVPQPSVGDGPGATVMFSVR